MTLSLFVASAGLVHGQAMAQASGTESEGLDGFWQAFVGGGHYMVKLSAVSSVSKHSYIMDGVARVTEVTVATDSAVTARFYCLTQMNSGPSQSSALNTVQSRLQGTVSELSKRTGAVDPNILQSEVVKNYPTTTHAHTVDYMLPSVDYLDSLYNSLTRAVADQTTGVSWSDQ